MRFSLNIFLSVLFFSNALYAITNLGTYGPVVKNGDKDMDLEIKKELAKRKPEYMQKIKQAYERSMTYHSNLPYSNEDKTIKEKPYSIASEDIYNKEGILLYKKGEKIEPYKSVPYGVKFEVCIVRFDNFKEFDKIIEAYGTKCKYVIDGIDIRKVAKKYNNLQLYLLNDRTISLLHIDKLPVKISISKDKISKEYLNYNRVKKEVMVDEGK